MPAPLYRILDANTNRCKEALRVSEDIARFVLNEKRLSSRFKHLRHGVTQIWLLSPDFQKHALSARDTRSDVGNKGLIRDRKKINWKDLMLSNLKRSQESLRVLEECSKVISVSISRKFQRLRFESYELEKQSLRRF